MNEVVIPYFYYKEEDIIKVYYFSSPIRFSVYPHEYYIKFYNKLINIYIPKINLETDSYSRYTNEEFCFLYDNFPEHIIFKDLQREKINN